MPKTVPITPAVGEILAMCEVRDNIVILPPGQLERGLYVAVDKVLKALGGKWDRKAAGHVFADGIGGQLADALANGEAVDRKRTLEQFFTPDDLGDRLCDLAGVTPGDHVLEPSFGDGRLIHAAQRAGADIITGVEVDPAMHRRVLYEITDGKFCRGVYAFVRDFLEWEPVSPVPIDRVVMNPPFSRNQDIAHVRRAFGFLRSGGSLAAIMSPHWTFANDAESLAFRAWLGITVPIPDGGIGWCGGAIGLASVHVERLPASTFKASGTEVNSVLIVLEKAS